MPITKLNIKENIFGDGIAKLESYDFSRANISEESRIKAVTTVASICYGNPKGIGSVSLYNRLECESMGLPSSSFEFVPVLLEISSLRAISNKYFKPIESLKVIKHGEVVFGSTNYYLTNLRALLEDVGKDANKFFNTPEECEIIKKHFKVFRTKVDLPTRSQLVRHRMTFQELSRRYVSDVRQPFEFYISEGMARVTQPEYCNATVTGEDYEDSLSTTQLIDMCVRHYHEALDLGIKPQEARRIIPQAAYSDIWIACLPQQYENFISQRTDKHAQWEIRQLALAMQEVTNV